MNTQLVVFRLCRAEYAVLIDKVKEVINYVPAPGLPGTLTGFDGAVSIRGRLVPVIDFAAKLRLAATQKPGRQVAIVEMGGMEIGLAVDAVTEVINTMQENFASVDSADADPSFRKVYLFHGRVITLLDVGKVLAETSQAV